MYCRIVGTMHTKRTLIVVHFLKCTMDFNHHQPASIGCNQLLGSFKPARPSFLNDFVHKIKLIADKRIKLV